MRSIHSRHFDPVEIEHKRSIVEAVTDEIGSDAEVAVDLHWNFSPETAGRICRAIEPYDLAWVEDPLPPENTDAMRELKRSVDVTLLTGENRYGRHGFRDLIETQAVDFAPDVLKTGGIAETKKIADMAETYYQALVPTTSAVLSRLSQPHTSVRPFRTLSLSSTTPAKYRGGRPGRPGRPTRPKRSP